MTKYVELSSDEQGQSWMELTWVEEIQDHGRKEQWACVGINGVYKTSKWYIVC